MMRRGNCGILFYARNMTPSEMAPAELAPRVEITVFEPRNASWARGQFDEFRTKYFLQMFVLQLRTKVSSKTYMQKCF
jgi:hypothetical protein